MNLPRANPPPARRDRPPERLPAGLPGGFACTRPFHAPRREPPPHDFLVLNQRPDLLADEFASGAPPAQAWA